jgi:hypothetical protein
MSWISKLLLASIAVLVLGTVGAGAFLAFWDIPVPVEKVEKTLPDARFPK